MLCFVLFFIFGISVVLAEFVSSWNINNNYEIIETSLTICMHVTCAHICTRSHDEYNFFRHATKVSAYVCICVFSKRIVFCRNLKITYYVQFDFPSTKFWHQFDYYSIHKIARNKRIEKNFVLARSMMWWKQNRMTVTSVKIRQRIFFLCKWSDLRSDNSNSTNNKKVLTSNRNKNKSKQSKRLRRVI